MTNKFSSKRPLTTEEEADIQKMIAADPDNPELTDEQIASAKPFAEVFPELAKTMEQEVAKRGRPRIESPKEAVTLRLDPATVAFFKEGGREWRTSMAEVLSNVRTAAGSTLSARSSSPGSSYAGESAKASGGGTYTEKVGGRPLAKKGRSQPKRGSHG